MNLTSKVAFPVLLLGVVLGGGIVACAKQGTPVSNSTTGRGVDVFETEKLFTVNDCTVYRFVDAGNYHYLTNCTSVGSRVSCGKNCTRDDSIDTTHEDQQ